jgi:uncharacterized OB-fold protein
MKGEEEMATGPNVSDAIFMDGAALDLAAEGGPQLVGGECADCGQKVFPAASMCFQCLSEQVRPVGLGREGKLYSFSVVRIAPKGYQAPYAIGYVDLPEGVRVLAHIVGADFHRLACDMDVRLQVGAIRTAEDGRPVISYQFAPITKEA